MTVYRLSGDKIRIALSDSEVLSFFGTYEKFASLSGGTRLAVSLLLKESLEKYGDILGDQPACGNKGKKIRRVRYNRIPRCRQSARQRPRYAHFPRQRKYDKRD